MISRTLAAACGLLVAMAPGLAAPAGAEERGRDIEYPAGTFAVPVEGRDLAISWDEGVIHTSRRERGAPIRIDLDVSMDLADLQAALSAQINGTKSNDSCGDQLRVSDARLRPASGGKAALTASVNYQRWECVKTKIPETRCTDTWIKLPFGGKTKGVPKCSVKWNMKEAKTRLLSQSADVAMDIVPEIRNDREVGVDARVTEADLSGLAGGIVDVFGWHREIRALAQKEAEKALAKQPLTFRLPDQADIADLVLKSIRFTDRGNGRLGAQVAGRGEISRETFIRILREVQRD